MKIGYAIIATTGLLGACETQCLSAVLTPMEVVTTDRLTGQRIDSIATVKAVPRDAPSSDTLVFVLREASKVGGVELQEGRYTLIASAPGYQTTVQDIRVGNRGCGGKFESFTISLPPSPR